MIFNRELDNDLWSGERSICLFVHGGRAYWVVDYKEHFCIDAEPEFKANLDKGRISEEQFSQYCRDFRYGILTLTKENFENYLNIETASVVSKEELESYLFSSMPIAEQERLHKAVEGALVFGGELSADDFKSANQIASKLPLFYINFDRRVYMHMDRDRCHETLVPGDWVAKAGDFSWLVPIDKCVLAQ